MAKKNKTDDLDFVLDDITEIKPAEAQEAIEKAVAEVGKKTGPLTDDEEYAEVLIRLKRACGAQWICLPRVDDQGKLRLIIRNLYDATGKEFVEWLKLIYPLAKNGGFTEEACEEYEYRDTTFRSVIKLYEQGYFKFPSTKIANSF